MNKQILYIFNSKLLKGTVFVIVFVIITNTIFSRFVKPNYENFLAVNLETIKDQNFDVFFMSNSYFFTAYDPLLLNSLTGLTSIHMGSPARSMCFEPFILEEILKEQNPKLVVLDISTTSLNVPKSDDMWHFNMEGLSNLPISFTKFKLFKDVIPNERNDLWLQGISSTTKTLYDITTVEELKYYGSGKKSTSGKVLGYSIRPKQNLKKLEKSKIKFDSIYKLSTKKSNISKDLKNNIIKEFNDFSQIINKYPDVQFLLIHSVKLNSNTEIQETTDLIDELTNSYNNVKILDLNKENIKQKLDLKFDDFCDPGHLMQSGSLKVTSYLSDYLKKHYDFENLKNDHNTSYVFKMKNKKNKQIINVKDIKLLVAENYNTDIIILIDSIPTNYDEVSTIVSIFPKKGFEHLLEEKSKNNKWKSDNSYRKFKNYIKTENGYIGKLNSWSKLKPKHIDRIEMKFSGPGILTETILLDLNKVNILQAR